MNTNYTLSGISKPGTKLFLILSPFIVLASTRIGIELFTELIRTEISWIPAFGGYYLAVSFIYLILRMRNGIKLLEKVSFSFRPFPGYGLFIGTILIPALLPLAAFLTQSQYVPSVFYIYIILFALINAPFEEFYWRGILLLIPGSNIFRILFSAGLFSFSHYFFWDYWYKSPIIMIPTLISTFLMGILRMHFMNQRRNLLYPILSHIVVDVLNLSVAVYSGLIDPPSF